MPTASGAMNPFGALRAHAVDVSVPATGDTGHAAGSPAGVAAALGRVDCASAALLPWRRRRARAHSADERRRSVRRTALAARSGLRADLPHVLDRAARCDADRGVEGRRAARSSTRSGAARVFSSIDALAGTGGVVVLCVGAGRTVAMGGGRRRRGARRRCRSQSNAPDRRTLSSASAMGSPCTRRPVRSCEHQSS